MTFVPSRMHLALSIGLLALIPFGTAVGAPVRAITKSEIRSDPPDVTDRRLKDAVWSLFERQDHRGKKAPTRPLSRLHLRTKTQATRVPGLCRYDSVRIELERVDPKDEGADAPVRPVGLTSTSNFTFLSPPAAEHDEIVQDRPVSVAQCSKLPQDQPFFTAENEEEATAGYRAWLAIIEAARAGGKVPLECNLTGFEKRSCGAVVGALRPEQLDEVEPCDSEGGTACHRLRAYDQVVTVVTGSRIHPGPPASWIVRAKLDALIILAHEIVD